MHEHSLEGGIAGYRSVMLWWGENDKDTRSERVSLGNKYNLQIKNGHSDMDHCYSLWEPGTHGDEKYKVCP